MMAQPLALPRYFAGAPQNSTSLEWRTRLGRVCADMMACHHVRGPIHATVTGDGSSGSARWGRGGGRWEHGFLTSMMACQRRTVPS
jgi:hypothetical protein